MNHEDLDLLVSRAAQGDADATTWAALESAAASDPAIWRAVAESQRDHHALVRMMRRAAVIADHVDAPGVSAPPSAHRRHVPFSPPVIHVPWRGSSWWAGWALAAVVLLAWGVTAWRGPVPAAPGTEGGLQQAGMVGTAPFGSARDAFEAYLDQGRKEGRVLSDRPQRVLLQSRPVPTGEGFEVIYVQQVIEKAVVRELYQFRDRDEGGRPVPVRYRPGYAGRM